MTETEEKRRRKLAHKMSRKVQAKAKTKTWRYEARVSPVYIRGGNDEWRIEIEGFTAEGGHRGESFDLATARAYHAMLGEVLRRFDAGEIKNPWDSK